MDFWHINQYAQGGDWHTRIGKFNFVGGGANTYSNAIATPTANSEWLQLGSRSGHAYRRWSELLASFSRPTGSFTLWAAATLRCGRRADFHHVRVRSRLQQLDYKSATYPDTQMNNMACGVLTDSGTDSIYCVGGSAAGAATATARVFRYDPVTDTTTLVASDDWPGDAAARFCLVGSRSPTTSCTSWVGSTSTWLPPTRSGSLTPNAAQAPVDTESGPAGSAWLYTHTHHRDHLHRWWRRYHSAGLLVTDTTNSFSL